MKLLLAAVILAGSSMAFANESFVANENKCAELQGVLREEGQLTLVRALGTTTYYASATECSIYQRASANYRRSADKTFCFVGYTCMDNMH